MLAPTSLSRTSGLRASSQHLVRLQRFPASTSTHPPVTSSVAWQPKPCPSLSLLAQSSSAAAQTQRRREEGKCGWVCCGEYSVASAKPRGCNLCVERGTGEIWRNSFKKKQIQARPCTAMRP